MKFLLNNSSAGKTGDKVRSDCFVNIELNNSKKVDIKLKSKVESLYGNSIIEQVRELSEYFEISGAEITIEDYGALPYVISARFECAVSRLKPEKEKSYLPESGLEFFSSSDREQFRRTRLYLPGNEPKFFTNAGLHHPDGIILDLEDSVAYTEKDSARILVKNALRSVNFYKSERMVRINQLPLGILDLNYVIPNNVNLILIPKCESAEQIRLVDKEIDRIKQNNKINHEIYLMPIIESALGIINAYEIASSSDKIVALTIGLEDYTADIGVKRTKNGFESLYARNVIVNAAKACRIQPIDSVYSDFEDTEGLRESTLESKSLGFEGKGCIHPRQIEIIHDVFKPTEEEINYANKIIQAFDEAEKKGIGVISVGSKMIDPPVIKRAFNIIKLVKKYENEG